MNILWPALFLMIAVGGLALVYWVVRGQRPEIYAPADLERYAKPVDLLAFQALLDPENERFLSETLSPAELRAFRRERCRIAAGYARRVAGNAAVLTRFAELARASADPATARAGEELANAAVQLRLLALLGYARLQLELLHPAAPEYIRGVAGAYESLADRAARVAALLEPAGGMRCARSLYSR
jgi:hypothetical protein